MRAYAFSSLHREATVLFRASDMILHNHSDAACLVASNARSRAGGYTFLGNRNNNKQIHNGPITILAKVIKHVMASAAEAEIAALFMNAKEALPLRITLTELGHPQPPTPLCADNNTANGIINGIFKQDRSKAIDMRFYWLVDRVQQGQFNVCWDSGKKNLADYFTKHHPPTHHKQVRPIYVHSKDSPRSFQGCVERLGWLARAGSNCHTPAAPAA